VIVLAARAFLLKAVEAIEIACHLALQRKDESRDLKVLCIVDLAERIVHADVSERYYLRMTFVIWADRIRE
jgi:hypothetical protein